MSAHPMTAEIGSILARELDCPVIQPGDAGYTRARHVWNGHVDKHPVAIVLCRTPDDALRAVHLVAENGIEFTVRGGGHNVSGNSIVDKGVVIDLQHLNQARYDADTGLVHVGAGALMGDVDRATAPHGLVVPAGVVSHTGVGGLTLGGGSGYLSRLFGATCDHVEAFDFIGADGRRRTVTAESEPDLFWSLRGAGHNFGIVTSFTFRPRAFDTRAYVRQTFHAAEDRKAVMQAVREWEPGSPDEMTTYVRLLNAPTYWSQLPAEHRGKPVLSLGTVYYGDPATGRAISDPAHGAAPAIWATDYQLPHIQLQHSCDDDYPHGVSRYWKPNYLSGMPDDLIDLAIEHADRYPGESRQARSKISLQPVSSFEYINRGGELGRVPDGHSAYSDRSSPYISNIGADWVFPDEEEALVGWARDFGAAISPYSSGSYVNFLSEEVGTEETRRIYANGFERLASVKRAVDPSNLFRHGGLALL